MPDKHLHDKLPDPLSSGSPGNPSRNRFANVLGVSIDAVDMEQALTAIQSMLHQKKRGYVCFVDVHGVLEALKSEDVAEAYEHAAMALPDGTPTVWVGRAQGLNEMDFVTGPCVMAEIFRRPEFAGYSHFLYGGEPGVAEELAATLRRQFPWTRIQGIHTPPFRDLTRDEEEALAAELSRLKPDVVWVGISTPRQDLWMRRMLPRLETTMMFGVGAAFDFLTGRIQLCPRWMKRAGLHWLHRLAQDPARLWSRNLRNSAFLWHIALQLTGAGRYPIRPRVHATGHLQPVAERGAPPKMAGSAL